MDTTPEYMTDTTPEYILQCEKAVEIQRMWKPALYDTTYCLYAAHIVVVNNSLITMLRGGINSLVKSKNYIWLPCQGQLQKMWEYAIAASIFALAAFLRNEAGFVRDDLDYIKSREQLELAFVMKEKYNKVWIGTDWRRKQ